MNKSKFAGGFVIFAVVITLIVGWRGSVIIDPGTVGVQVTLGDVNAQPLTKGWHIIKPWSDVTLYDIKRKDKKETLTVQTQDQLPTAMEVSIQYRIDGGSAPALFEDTGDAEAALNVHVLPYFRSITREKVKGIKTSNELFQETVQTVLQADLTTAMQAWVKGKGITIDAVLVRKVTLPLIIQKGIEKKKVRDQLAEEQKAELLRFATEQEQKIKTAESEYQAAILEAKQVEVLADAEGYRITKINAAIQSNPAYVQLKQIEAFSKLAEKGAKFTFLNGGGNILPHIDLTQAAPIIKK